MLRSAQALPDLVGQRCVQNKTKRGPEEPRLQGLTDQPHHHLNETPRHGLYFLQRAATRVVSAASAQRWPSWTETFSLSKPPKRE